ncbi:Hsp70 family protein [bacterium]|nr:Hsp70 family protein [bacterium]
MSNWLVGIDLGTSNTALARIMGDEGKIETLKLTQRVSESEVREQSLLPSFLYLPGAHELPEGSLALPWDKKRDFMVGEFARVQGSRVPGRVVVSAKSWLAHRQADPSQPLLPWDGAPDAPRVSPVEASRRYLEHLREAFLHQYPDHPLDECEIVLTVPASFDELARELTVSAARQAGLDKITLLEEPQAAFYHYLYANGLSVENPQGLNPGDQILVCDIGGGTSDFTLIEYAEKGLRRVAVGEHLMLGGDNLDISLAYLVEPRLGSKLDILQWGVLRNECRRAKELLLGDDPPDKVTVTVPGSGSKLLAGTMQADLTREEVEKLVLDGFFPQVPIDEPLQAERRLGFKEWGLPYASDPAVPRHLSSFLRRHGRRDNIPNKILFNGGACRATAIRQRMLGILEKWRGGPVEELPNPESDLSVARGAAYYGHLKRSGGKRIGGGIARSYYLQLSTDGTSTQALCVVPRNLEAGSRVDLQEPVLHLTLERPVRFPIFSSSNRPEDQPGTLVDIAAAGGSEESEFQVLPAMETVVRAPDLKVEEVPVLLSGEVTEIGTLSIACRMLEGKRRFQLEFPLRGDVVLEGGPEFPPEVVKQAKEMIAEAFQRKPKSLGQGGVRPRSLLASLEQHFGLGRQLWSVALLRALWDGFVDVHARRRVEPEYEQSWLNGVGYCLRPGTGSKLDAWRVEKTSALLDSWLQFPKLEPVRMELWVTLRRLAAGLSVSRQEQLWTQLAAVMIPGRKHWKTRVPHERSLAEDNELLRLAVSLSQIPVGDKVLLGEIIMKKFQGTRDDLWRIARIGSRNLLGAGPQWVVPPDAVWPWVSKILDSKWVEKETIGWALATMMRKTDDIKRDFSEEQMDRVRNRLIKEGQQAHLASLDGETGGQQEAAALLGEALPVGIRL